MKPKILISFSGGRTSAYMLWLILQWREFLDVIVVFANTGKESEGTLQFVRDCAINFNVEIIWVEGFPVSEKGWKVSYKIVDFGAANRTGQPFEDMIAKLGIPSTAAPFCSDQLKRKVILSYIRSLGWKDFYVAIGIRADEIDRVNPKWKEKKLLYPLVHLNITKPIILDYWRVATFDLLLEHKDDGNCDNCWKKSQKTLVGNMRRRPESFDWWEKMHHKYGDLAPRPAQKKMSPPFRFFRGNMSVRDIGLLAQTKDSQLEILDNYETANGCSESCEVF